MPAPCTLPWGCFTSLGPGSQTSCCKQLLHPVPHLCCNPGSIIPAPHRPSLSHHTHLQPAQSQGHTCSTAGLCAVLCPVLQEQPSPLSSSQGISSDRTQHIRGCHQVPKAEPDPAGCWDKPAQQSQTWTGNPCSPGPREEQECITDTRSYPQHRQSPALLLTPPQHSCSSRSHTCQSWVGQHF